MPMDLSPRRDTHRFQVALLQMHATASRDENLARAVEQIERAAAAGADLVCLPELFSMPYPCRDEDHERFALAEPIPGPTTERLARAAAASRVVVVGSIFERRGPGLYHNAAIVLERDGRLVGHYRKMHVPDDPNYYEKFYFAPGDLGFPVWETSAGRIGVAVCWDQWFPEVARLLALAGAEIVLYPTAIGWLADEKETWGASQQAAWRRIMQSHAIANGLYVAGVNRWGVEGSIEFWGHSFVADPYGTVLAAAEPAGDEIVLAECDTTRIETARTHWPFLRDRRVDAYQGLLRRWID